MRSKTLSALFPPLTPDDRRWQFAVHESSHAVVAWSYSRDVEMISIRPAGRLDGWCLHSLGPSISEQLALGGIEAQPSALRRRAEQEAIIRLAGPSAEALAALGRRGDDPEEDRVRGRLAELAELVPADADLLEREERLIASEPEPGPMDDDAGRAFLQSHGLTGAGEEAIAHYQLMRAVARRKVVDLWPQIHALARALYERTVIPGGEAEQTIEGALSKGVQSMPSKKVPIAAGPDPNKLYRALWGHRSRDGSRVVRTNAVLRGDDPLVAESFDLFVEDAPAKEIERARAASIRATRPELPRLADADAVVVAMRVRVDGTWLRPGDRFPKASLVVRRHPDWFGPVGSSDAA